MACAAPPTRLTLRGCLVKACLRVRMPTCLAQGWHSTQQIDATSPPPGPLPPPPIPPAQLGLSSLRGEAPAEGELRILETYMNGRSGAGNCRARPGQVLARCSPGFGGHCSLTLAALGCSCGLPEGREGSREATPPKHSHVPQGRNKVHRRNTSKAAAAVQTGGLPQSCSDPPRETVSVTHSQPSSYRSTCLKSRISPLSPVLKGKYSFAH